ncbi:hypothetical protein CWI23_28385 [Pseudomonas aeruginosa]|nr:hypothetical protein CWI22_28340 [Pseudomonas aeruginosa]AUA92219.1 hypothetical protein CWI23_28385 [Pseudomonas aeruginosa]
MCRAAADNAYGVIRPTVRSTAPTSASTRPAPSIKPWRRANNRIAVIRRLCRAAADNAYGVIRPTVRSTAPTSASARPAPSIKPGRRADNRIAVIRRFGRTAALARILGSVHQQATNRHQSLAEKPAPSFFRNRLPTNPWDAAKPLIHGLPEAFITSSPTDLPTILQESERAASALMRIGTAPALEQITKISGASVQAGWGIPSFTPGGRRSIRAQPPHPFRGPRYRQAENSPLLCPAVAQ